MCTPKSQSCAVSLTIGRRTIYGRTGRNHGHAEMDALHEFILKFGGEDVRAATAIARAARAMKQTGIKLVYCPSRDCCLKCSYILKALGFQAGRSSNFSGTRMGSTEWGASNYVRDFLKAMNVSYRDATEL